MIPDILKSERVYWSGVDDSTPEGCELVSAVVLDVPTTYIVRDGQILGRIEHPAGHQSGYVGSTLKGGRFIGSVGLFLDLAQKIVDYRPL